MKAGARSGWAYDLSADLAGGVCYAVGMYVFAMHADFAPGGVSGLALLLNRLLGLPVGLGTLLLNLPLFALSYRFVGRRFLARTLRSTVICVLFLMWCSRAFRPTRASRFWQRSTRVRSSARGSRCFICTVRPPAAWTC